jgi:glycerol-3-phosphate acyltransferase PlsY
MGILLAYLLGSLSSAILISRLMRLPDPRTAGSLNPGATNVLRLGGKTAAALTLAGDVLKGWLPVFVFLQLEYYPIFVIGLIGLAAFFGHLYPVYFSFKGGKGVATALGVLLAVSPLTGLLTLLTWLFVAAVFRYSSLAALAAALLAPVYLYWLLPPEEYWLVGMAAIMAAFLFLRHRGNLRRLLDGTEPRIGRRKPVT